MNVVVKNSIRFIVLVLLQAFVFNQIEIGFGIHLMVQPLFIMLLPFETGVITLMILGFTLGLILDIFSNTYGLQASSLLLMA
jgi:rod shape-determining protein MreD